ncbi:hypothetical protein [Leptonema illini]|uniref:Uncharacterized protein n=1 Tax=Leptonema illini DSM 21528 TaxID=929563 RepID=H2CL73_9LEPT|nr:hypothetical protein [Leptonema illini]EHQ08324.1 hypothetical protein Lepil_3667 [Leptonema illini DSM 21528]
MNTTPGIVWPQRGKAVYQEDLDFEQVSKDDAIVNRTADHYSHGVQFGGEVTIAGAGLISVGPTLAYDIDGKRIHHPSSQSVIVPDGSWIVALRHEWSMSDGVDPDLSGTSVQYRNDSYVIVLRAAAQPGDIPLWSVTFAAGVGTLGADLRSLRSMTIAGGLDVGGKIRAYGGIEVFGSMTSIETVNQQIKDAVIDLNHGETGAGVSLGYAGLRVMRGSLPAQRLVFDEAVDRFRAGVEGSEELIALLSEVFTQAQINAFFSGEAGGKKLVDWANVINKPASTTIGRLGIYIEPTSPAGVLYFGGTYPSRAAYAGLWDWVSARPSLIDDANKAKFGTGDGATTFRLPDWRGLGVRGAGASGAFLKANGSYYDGGLLMGVILDQLLSHRHQIFSANGPSGGSTTAATFAISSPGGTWADWSISGPTALSSGIRTGDETRGATVGIHWGISYE